MEEPTDIKIPILTDFALPSAVTVDQLSDPSHPVNDKAISGKREGKCCMIGKDFYIATGAQAASPWVKQPSAIDLFRLRPVYGTMAITHRDIADTEATNEITVVAHPSGTDTLNPPATPQPVGASSYGGTIKSQAI